MKLSKDLHYLHHDNSMRYKISNRKIILFDRAKRVFRSIAFIIHETHKVNTYMKVTNMYMFPYYLRPMHTIYKFSFQPTWSKNTTNFV